MKGRSLVVVAFLAALAGALYAAFGPTYGSCDMDGCGSESTVSVNGWWVLAVIAVPVVFALAPVVFDRRPVRIASAVLLWAFCVITGFSVGLFFVPAAILMTIASVRSDPVPTTAT